MWKAWMALLFLFFLLGCVQPSNDSNAPLSSSNLLHEQRENYGIPLSAFEELPSPPQDFNFVVSEFQKSNFSDSTFFTPAYFLQPEFFPNFALQGLRYWKESLTQHRGVYGYGVYPSDIFLAAKKGETIRTRVFVHSAYGIQSWQGIGLREDANNAFPVSLSRSSLLLGPSFPKFSKEWVQVVDVSVSIPSNAPRGTQVLSFDLVAPPSELSEQWREKYGSQYVEGGAFSLSRPFVQVHLSVE